MTAANPQAAIAALQTRIATLQAALDKAASGQVARIRENEKWIEYHQGDTAALIRLIAQAKDDLAALGVRTPGARGRSRRPVYLG
jgi:hypothetical protein